MFSVVFRSLILVLSIFIFTPANASELDQKLFTLLNDQGGRSGYKSFVLPSDSEWNRIPQDPENPITPAKVELGMLLFHETALGVSPKQPALAQTYSCASCHHAAAGFSSGNLQGLGEGGLGFGKFGEDRAFPTRVDPALIDAQPIKSPAVLNLAWQRNLLWNGQFGANALNRGTEAFWLQGTPKFTNHLGFDGVEIQAIAGMEVHRLIPTDPTLGSDAIHRSGILKKARYEKLFFEAFPELNHLREVEPVHLGLAIAAYERTLLANQAPFQKWLRGKDSAMTSTEKEGALLFFGKARCSECHSGPALNSMGFHALGFDDFSTQRGALILNPDFTEALGRASFTQQPKDMHCFKVPQLYNLKDHHSLGHGGSFASVQNVIEYKNQARSQKRGIPSHLLSPGFKPLGLNPTEIEKLTDFVENALHDAHLHRYTPETLPSGNCFPNADLDARRDTHCTR